MFLFHYNSNNCENTPSSKGIYQLDIYIHATLVLNKCHKFNHPVKKAWLHNTIKLPPISRLKLVAATTAAGLMATICGVIKGTTPRLLFVSSDKR